MYIVMKSLTNRIGYENNGIYIYSNDLNLEQQITGIVYNEN